LVNFRISDILSFESYSEKRNGVKKIEEKRGQRGENGDRHLFLRREKEPVPIFRAFLYEGELGS